MLITVHFCISGLLLEAQFMCSDKHGSFLQLLVFAFSRYVAQVFSEPFFRWFQLPLYYWYGFCFYIPRVLCFYCKVFMFQDFLIFFLHHISVSRICKIKQDSCSCWPYYGLWYPVYCYGRFCLFTLFIPQYVYLTFISKYVYRHIVIISRKISCKTDEATNII